VTDNKTVQV